MYKEYNKDGRELTAEELVDKYKKYAIATATRFLNRDETNRYTFNEVYSVCLNSIWESLRKYKENKGAKISTYIIRNCRFAILDMVYGDRNYYAKDKKKLDKPMGSLNILGDEDSTEEIINDIESTYENKYDDVDFKDLVEYIYNFGCKKNGKKLPRKLDRNIKVVCDRYKGFDLKQVANRREMTLVGVNRVMREFNSYAKEYYNSKFLKIN